MSVCTALLFSCVALLAFIEAKNIAGKDGSDNLSQFVEYSSITPGDIGGAWLEDDAETVTTDLPTTTTIPDEESTLYSEVDSTGNLTNVNSRLYPAATANEAAVGQFPFYVFLTVTTSAGTTTACNGALLSDSWAVTAAQCVYIASQTKVVAATVDTSIATPPSSFGVVHIHPGFRKNYMIHDIALIRLLAPFTLGANIFPIKLQKTDVEMNAVTVGIGAPADGSAVATKVYFIDLVHVNKATCLSQTKEIFVEYPPTTACLSSSSSTKGTCAGDFGAPVIYTYPNELAPTLLGINSLYQGCPSGYPMAYTRVAPYYHWIKSKVTKLLK